MFLNIITYIKQKIINIRINGRSQRIKHKKSNLLLFWWYDWYRNFYSKLLKIGKKSHIDIDTYYIGYIIINRFNECENIRKININL